MKYIRPYCLLHALIWLPWGLLCIVDIRLIENIIAVSSAVPHGQTDIRAMYGGVQSAMGLMALLACIKPRYFSQFVFALAFIAGGLALSRTFGLFVDGSYGLYTGAVLAYEYFAACSAMLWLMFLSKLNHLSND